MSSTRKNRNYGFQIAFWAGLFMTGATCILLIGFAFQFVSPLQKLINLKIKYTTSEIQERNQNSYPIEIIEESEPKSNKRDTVVIFEKIILPCPKNHCDPNSSPTISNPPLDSNSN